MTDKKRLIEVAFPLKQASIDSVHEKNVRHGHISTLHIWPARRPLAASRAALIATLLPDPGDKAIRDEILLKLAGTIKEKTKKKKQANGQVEDVATEETEGGILHWGRESGPGLDWFRAEIRKAYGGRAPKVLDPFAGGGAIPLEAMRLGCEVTAADINPVAWFILKCTLEYPQQLAGQTRRLPEFALRDREFMAAYLKAKGLTPATIKRHLNELFPPPSAHKTDSDSETESVCTQSGENIDLFGHDPIPVELLEGDLAWHVRAWGLWVLKEARKSLARFYPTYAEYCSEKPYAKVPLAQDNAEHLKLVPINELGEPQIELLNAGLAADKGYLDNLKNPRWIAKPTVAYLWARTVKCKACRAVLPLLKTRWLCKKDIKRVLLTMAPDAERRGVIFGIDPAVKQASGNVANKREHDKKLGAGTMSRSGASCPCCGTIMTMEDIRLEGRAGKLGAIMTTVVMDSPGGKEYRLPTAHELEMAESAQGELERVFADVPFGMPSEPTPKGGSGASRAFSVDGYGLDQWQKLFTPRQLVSVAELIGAIRKAYEELSGHGSWQLPLAAYLTAGLSRLLDFANCGAQWKIDVPTINHSFVRFALPISWDYAESNVLWVGAGSYLQCAERIVTPFDNTEYWSSLTEIPNVVRQSATQGNFRDFDVIITDPPYYDAIPYSDMMDFFYIWLRRTLFGLSPEYDSIFSDTLSPKWNHQANDGELIDDASRFKGNAEASKNNYENGMALAFTTCHAALRPEGRLVVVFAHKHPDAWETLVAAIIRAGFVVDGSWPIQTEQTSRMRAISSAALSSSIWMVCKKRNPLAKAGWDAQVLQEMESNIVQKLRDFWDAGIHGPDFVWAATGPALESYSRYPAVKKASEPGALMGVNEFLRHVRRIVVDFVVGRVLSGDAADNNTIEHALDNVTSYYLLHRYDFGMKDAPAGACILYAVSCGLSERELTDQYALLVRSGSAGSGDDEAEDDGEESEVAEATGSGGQFKLNPWIKRKHKNLGQDSASGRPTPLIDQIHQLMHLWQAGDVIHVNDYLDARGLRRSRIFVQLLQALIELAPVGDSERTTLERLSNHVKGLGSAAQEGFGF